MEVGKPRTKKRWGILFLAALALLVLVSVRVGIALADTGGEEVRPVYIQSTGGSDMDRVLFLSPAPPLPAPSSGAVATPAPTPTPVETPVATPSPTPVATPKATPTPELQTMQVALTFYTCPPFCLGDPMANTEPLHEGAAACGYALKMGQRFEFDGEEYRCEDRGGGPWAWVDFWKPDYDTGATWQARVGVIGEITLVGE